MSAHIICVSTDIDRFLKPDMSAVFGVCRKIAFNTSHDLFVSIESTVAIGTGRKIYESIFKRSVNLVHIPHRYWSQDTTKHGVRQLRVIGSIDKDSLRTGLRVYQQLDIPLHPVFSIETAEMSKTVENSYRFLQIAFVEELRMMCNEHSVDMTELRRACNTKWNTKILEAKDVILGHCLSKDTHYVIDSSRNSKLLRTAVSVDKKYKRALRTKRLLDDHDC